MRRLGRDLVEVVAYVWPFAFAAGAITAGVTLGHRLASWRRRP